MQETIPAEYSDKHIKEILCNLYLQKEAIVNVEIKENITLDGKPPIKQIIFSTIPSLNLWD